MKARGTWLALVVLLAVNGSARSDFIATATLTGDGESDSPGTGKGTVTYTAATDSLAVTLTFSGLTSATYDPPGVPGASHIHYGSPGVSGSILFPFLNFPIGVTSGSYSTVLTAANLIPDPAAGINTFAEAVNAITAGNTYFNIHTVAFPDGEIRGQILVPEPASVILLALGVSGILAIARFGRRNLNPFRLNYPTR